MQFDMSCSSLNSEIKIISMICITYPRLILLLIFFLRFPNTVSMAEKKQRLPRYARVPNPPSMRLTERDRRILEAVHSYDGMLSFPQIQRLFFTGRVETEQRLKLLYQHRYLARPDRDERRRLPEMIYWLDEKGAEIVASLSGTPLKEFPWRGAALVPGRARSSSQ